MRGRLGEQSRLRPAELAKLAKLAARPFVLQAPSPSIHRRRYLMHKRASANEGQLQDERLVRAPFVKFNSRRPQPAPTGRRRRRSSGRVVKRERSCWRAKRQLSATDGRALPPGKLADERASK